MKNYNNLEEVQINISQWVAIKDNKYKDIFYQELASKISNLTKIITLIIKFHDEAEFRFN